MLTRSSWRLRMMVRCYGWEKPQDRHTKNWWMYADSDTFGDFTPQQRGFRRVAKDAEKQKMWETQPVSFFYKSLGEGGTDPESILDRALTVNPLGPYDTNLELLHVGEIKTRILHVLRHFECVDLRELKWTGHMEDDLKLDQYDRTAFLTSVEHEFNTIFEDNVFDSMKTLNDVVKYLEADRYIF